MRNTIIFSYYIICLQIIIHSPVFLLMVSRHRSMTKWSLSASPLTPVICGGRRRAKRSARGRKKEISPPSPPPLSRELGIRHFLGNRPTRGNHEEERVCQMLHGQNGISAFWSYFFFGENGVLLVDLVCGVCNEKMYKAIWLELLALFFDGLKSRNELWVVYHLPKMLSLKHLAAPSLLTEKEHPPASQTSKTRRGGPEMKRGGGAFYVLGAAASKGFPKRVRRWKIAKSVTDFVRFVPDSVTRCILALHTEGSINGQ